MSGVYKSPEGERVLKELYRGFLDRWPVPAEMRHVPTRNGETFVVSCGPEDAPPLVLLHGSGANASMWLDDVAVWAASFRVHAVDMIGEPGLSAAVRLPLDSERHALWLDDVLAGLGVERAAFLGVSLGGWLALDHAVRRPERVERLVLVSPGGVGRQKVAAVLMAGLLLPFGRWGRRRAMAVVLGGRGGQATRREVELGEYVMTVHRHFTARRDRLPVFSDERLAALTMPVLVIAGDRDPMFDSPGTMRRLPQAEHLLLPGVGHFVQGQAPAILEFLEKETVHGHA